MSEPTLAQRLGYPADARLVIINADDLGIVPLGQRGDLRTPTRGPSPAPR